MSTIGTTIFSNTVHPSFTPPVDPGKVITKVVPVTPATARETTAVGMFFNPSAQNACTTPGSSRSRCGCTASTVRSSAVIPVPPEVN